MNPQQPGGPWPPNNQQPQNGQYPLGPGQVMPPQPYMPPQPQNNLPEQQYGAPAPGQDPYHQQYEFIMNQQNNIKYRAPLIGGSGNKTMRIALVAVVILGVLIGAAALLSVLNKPQVSTTEMVAVTQRQSELMRIADIGNSKSTTQTVLNSANTIKLTLSSEQKQLVSYLATNNVKLTPVILAQRKSTATDTQLANALAASTFDSSFNAIIQAQLAAYQKSLKAAYDANPGPKGQALLKADYDAAGLLIAQNQQR